MPKERTFSPVPSAEGTPPARKGSKLAVPFVLPKLQNQHRDTDPVLEDSAQTVAVQQESISGPTDDPYSPPSIQPSHEDGGYILIDAGLIDQNAHPPRTLYLDDNIKSVAESMQLSGQRDAIHVIPHPDKPGRFIIGDGWTRVLATRSYNINDNKVLAKVHFGLTEEQASWLGYSQNKDRSPPTDLDLAHYYQGWHANGMPWEDIADRAGVSKSLMSYYASFNRLDPEILSLAKAAPLKFTANAAFHLSRLQQQAGRDSAMGMANRFLQNDLSIKQLKENVDDALERLGRQKSKRESSNKVMLQRAFPGGHFRQRLNGLVEMSATVPEDRINYFNQRLEELLKEVLLSADPASESQDGGSQSQSN